MMPFLNNEINKFYYLVFFQYIYYKYYNMYKFDNKKIKKYLNILGKMSLKDENYREKYLNEINKIINNAKGGALLDDILNSSGFLPMSDENKMKIDWMWKHKKGLNPAPLSAKYRLNLCGIDGEKISNQIIQNNGFFLPDINSNQDWDSGGSSNICIKMYRWCSEEYENDLFNLGYTMNTKGDYSKTVKTPIKFEVLSVSSMRHPVEIPEQKIINNLKSNDPGIISYINNEKQSYILGNYINSSDGIFDIDKDDNNKKKNKLLDFLKNVFIKKGEHKGGADDNRVLLIKKELQKILRDYNVNKINTITPVKEKAIPPPPQVITAPNEDKKLSFLYYYCFLYYYMLSTINIEDKSDDNVKSFFDKLFNISEDIILNFNKLRTFYMPFFFTILLLECNDNSFLFCDFLTKYINITEGAKKNTADAKKNTEDAKKITKEFLKLYVQLSSNIKKLNCKNFNKNFDKNKECKIFEINNDNNIDIDIVTNNTNIIQNNYNLALKYYNSFVKMRNKNMGGGAKKDEILSVKYAKNNIKNPLNKDQSINDKIITKLNKLFNINKSEKVHYGHWEEMNVDYTLPDKLEILLKKDTTDKKTKHLFKAGDMYYLTDNQMEFLEKNLICKKKN